MRPRSAFIYICFFLLIFKKKNLLTSVYFSRCIVHLGTPVESVERTGLRVALSAQEHVECPQLPSLFSLTNTAHLTVNTGYVCVKVSVVRPINESLLSFEHFTSYCTRMNRTQ